MSAPGPTIFRPIPPGPVALSITIGPLATPPLISVIVLHWSLRPLRSTVSPGVAAATALRKVPDAAGSSEQFCTVSVLAGATFASTTAASGVSRQCIGLLGIGLVPESALV